MTVAADDALSRWRALAEEQAIIIQQQKAQLERIERWTRSAASDASNLAQIHQRVAPGELMPILGERWAATPATIVWMVDTILRSAHDPYIVECGSGSSTVWMAAGLRARGGEGHIVAIEHETQYAEKTRSELERRGLAQFATVVHAPLTQLNEEVCWYDPSSIPLGESIDLLFVDGPPGQTISHARFPAFAVLGPALADGAFVVLDDTDRRDESEIAQAWQQNPVAGRHLTQVEDLGRALAFSVRVSSAAASSAT